MADMALRLFERTLANVRTDLRPLYVADDEHGYRLDLIDLDEFVHGLRSALRKQRDDNKALRAKFGITPDGAEALAPFGVMPRAHAGGTVPDVRAGLPPRSGTPQRATTE
jgi:hypothetical protein